jgi:hypothetical protein
MTYTINAAGTIEGANGVEYQLRFDRDGRKPVFRAFRDANGHVQTTGEALFDAQKMWNEPNAAGLIAERAKIVAA